MLHYVYFKINVKLLNYQCGFTIYLIVNIKVKKKQKQNKTKQISDKLEDNNFITFNKNSEKQKIEKIVILYVKLNSFRNLVRNFEYRVPKMKSKKIKMLIKVNYLIFFFNLNIK